MDPGSGRGGQPAVLGDPHEDWEDALPSYCTWIPAAFTGTESAQTAKGPRSTDSQLEVYSGSSQTWGAIMAELCPLPDFNMLKS